MTNKVLIKLIIPKYEISYDLFIPVNEIVWKLKKMIMKCVQDLSGISFDTNSEYVLFNKDNSRYYNNNDIIINTDIRNGTELILFSVPK